VAAGAGTPPASALAEWAATQVPLPAALAVLCACAALPPLAAAAAAQLRPLKCRRCLGASSTVCDACRGRGKVGGLFTGQPLAACAACAGAGVCGCAACGATGLANSWLWKPTKADGAWGARGE